MAFESEAFEKAITRVHAVHRRPGRRKRQLSLVQRRQLLLALPAIVEGPPEPGFDTGDQWTTLQVTHRSVFRRFDALPQEIRRTLHEITVTFDPVPIAAFVARNTPRKKTSKRIIAFVKAAILQEEAEDIRKFAISQEAKFKYRYPHIAARASILRYGSADAFWGTARKRKAA